MPELPEVETLRRQLSPVLTGTRVLAVVVHDARLCDPLPVGEFEAALLDRVVLRIARRGKHLLFELGDGSWLVLHLRMTGNLLVVEQRSPRLRYERARFTFERRAGRDECALAFCDPRRFGTAQVFPDRSRLLAWLEARLGPEPLSDRFDAAILGAAIAGRRAPIKALLLDQRVLAGVGNIYADEALFRAGIHPARAACKLRRSELEALVSAIKAALQAGIEHQGASIDDFRHSDGRRGRFQDEFLVHRRLGQPCPRCGEKIRKERIAGRGTYYCRRCQPPPRARRRAAPADAPRGRPPRAR